MTTPNDDATMLGMEQPELKLEENLPQAASRHHAPKGFSDRFALLFTKVLRFCADTFFAKRADEAHHRDINHGFASKLAGLAPDVISASPYPTHSDEIRLNA